VPQERQQSRHAVTVLIGDASWSATEDDAFEALCQIRLELDREGWLLAVEGSRVRSYPSGMARDQGGGLVVYRMEDDAPVTRDSVRGIFEPVDVAECGTVVEQLAYFTQRIA
jgi:hypothetical protein